MAIANIEAVYNEHVGEWVIQATTEGFGAVFILDKSVDLPIPMCFMSEHMANEYIKEYKFEHRIYLAETEYKEDELKWLNIK